MTPTDIIDDHRRTHQNRYPRNDSLAKLLGVTVAEATAILNRHKKDHGERVRNSVLDSSGDHVYHRGET